MEEKIEWEMDEEEYNVGILNAVSEWEREREVNVGKKKENYRQKWFFLFSRAKKSLRIGEEK
jgi:hypothetical protein